jgi:hypothetical protein
MAPRCGIPVNRTAFLPSWIMRTSVCAFADQLDSPVLDILSCIGLRCEAGSALHYRPSLSTEFFFQPAI